MNITKKHKKRYLKIKGGSESKIKDTEHKIKEIKGKINEAKNDHLESDRNINVVVYNRRQGRNPIYTEYSDKDKKQAIKDYLKTKDKLEKLQDELNKAKYNLMVLKNPIEIELKDFKKKGGKNCKTKKPKKQ
jgi:hypothetical protein